MNDCIRNKAGLLIGLFTLLGCFAIRAQDIAVKNEFTLWRVVTNTKHRGGMGNISQTDC